MTYISKLENVKSERDALAILYGYDDNLNYNREALYTNYRIGEVESLAVNLCGIANKSTAIVFMKGNDMQLNLFFRNVAFNSDDSIPLVLRAIQLRMINKK